jgi:hypothetical protein
LEGLAYNPYQPPQIQNDPRLRRARRERAVFHCGGTPAARTAVEQFGDELVDALAVCPPDVACKLAEFAAAPDGLQKLPNPQLLLRAIAAPNHGPDVAVWAIQHATELSDIDRFAAYCAAPLEYALGLQSLDAGAAQYRANRLAASAAHQPAFTLPADWRPYAVGAAAIALAIWWWRGRRQGP